MTREDYCSYELSKLLKEKGFDESCNSFYILLDNGDYRPTMSDFPYKNSCKYNVSSFARPTHQMAMKWLREVHKIWFLIYRDFDNQKWDYGIYHNDYGEELNSGDEHYYKTYEEAVEAALKYVLENLI